MIERIIKDQFIKNNIIFFAGSMIAAFFNYAYHPIMSRLLSVSDFGEMQALISLTYIIGIFLIVFGIIAVNIVTNYDRGHAIKKISDLFSFVLPMIILFSVGIIVASPFLKEVLNFTSYISFLPLVCILCIDVVNTFYGAFLRGTKEFGILSITMIISSAGRIIFGVILVLIGLRVFGAIGAFALATFTSLLYAWYRMRGVFTLKYVRSKEILDTVKNERSYAFLVLSSIGFVTFLYSSDILFAKYYFDPETAGLYSGIATIARSIFFATGSVAAVLLPSVIIHIERKNNRKILLKAMIINGMISVSAMLVFIFLPQLTISLMLGTQYLEMMHILAYAGVSAIFISIVNIAYTYYLALRDKRLIYSSFVGLMVICILMVFNHQSPQAIITNYLITSIAVLGVLAICKYINNDKEQKLR
jgi:O-antigen/teichoic acid export membrane protein